MTVWLVAMALEWRVALTIVHSVPVWLLSEKTRQMKAMAAELNMLQAQVNEYRFELERVTRELQETKVPLISYCILPATATAQHNCLIGCLVNWFVLIVIHDQRKFLELKKRDQVKEGRDGCGVIMGNDPLALQQQQFNNTQPRIAGGGFNISALAATYSNALAHQHQQHLQQFQSQSQSQPPSTATSSVPMASADMAASLGSSGNASAAIGNHKTAPSNPTSSQAAVASTSASASVTGPPPPLNNFA